MSRLAVVCGGSRGIGRAVSRLLAERACRLAVVSRNEDAARSTVASLHGGIELCAHRHRYITSTQTCTYKLKVNLNKRWRNILNTDASVHRGSLNGLVSIK